MIVCGFCGDEAVAEITADSPTDLPETDPDHRQTQVGMKVCELHRQNAEHYGFATRFLPNPVAQAPAS